MSCVTQIEYNLLASPNSVTHQQYYKSVVRLTLNPGPKGSAKYQATGFTITKDHLLTAGHYCDRLQENKEKGINSKFITMEVADRDGVATKFAYATIVANHEEHDMCIIKSENHGLVPLSLMGDMSIVETEDPITVLGAPRAFFPVRRDGYVISKAMQMSEMDIQPLLLLAINVEPGSSGSPVIWNGQVIGIVVRHFGNIFKDAALATRGDHIVKFVDSYIDRSK